MGELLRREGLVTARRRRQQREPHPGRPQIAAREPNDLWTTDFKGAFPAKNGWWCYPLTVLDHASRMCLAIDGLGSPNGGRAGPVFERAFGEFGLPRAILSDNGAPFAAVRGLRGLTKLSVWWLELGIQPIRIEPASPEQNGAHECFHRTLEAETSKPPAGDRNAQQRRFSIALPSLAAPVPDVRSEPQYPNYCSRPFKARTPESQVTAPTARAPEEADIEPASSKASGNRGRTKRTRVNWKNVQRCARAPAYSPSGNSPRRGRSV